MKHYTINKPPHGGQEWLMVRWSDQEGRPRISASVAGAVHNQHRFTTPADLAIELLASEPPTPREPNAAMVRGQKLEPVIMKWAAEMEGLTLDEPQVMYAYEEEGVRLIATLDAIDAEGNVYEIKTVNRRWDGSLPPYWYWQGVQQAICANVSKVEWVIFDSDMVIHRYTQTITSDEKQIHIQKCREFLAAIDEGVMPEIAKLEYRHASELHPNSEPTTVSLSDEAFTALSTLNAIQSEIKQLEEHESEYKAKICMEIGENEFAEYGGNVVCSWKSASRKTFDTKKFEQDHPALASKYRKETTYRTFKTTKGGK